MSDCGSYAGYKRHLRAEEPYCDQCRIAYRDYHRAYRTANKDRVRGHKRTWRMANKDKIAVSARAYNVANRDDLAAKRIIYYAENKDIIAAKVRADRAANPEKYNARSRAYREANKDKEAERHRLYKTANKHKAVEHAARRRARKRDALHIPFTDDQLRQRLSMFPGCWMCGGDAGTIDHVIPFSAGGAHCLSNLRPACGPCNFSKGPKPWRDFVCT